MEKIATALEVIETAPEISTGFVGFGGAESLVGVELYRVLGLRAYRV